MFYIESDGKSQRCNARVRMKAKVRPSPRIRLDVIQKHKGFDALPHIARTDQTGDGAVALAMGFENDGCIFGSIHGGLCKKRARRVAEP